MNPFAKRTPSLFIVCSPFQVLCALEAIEKFDIKEYKFLLNLISDPRNKQLFNLLNEKKIDYEIIDFSCRTDISYKLKLSLLIPRWNKFKRAFIGDYRSREFHYIAFKKLSNNSSIVFLDDGNCNVPLLEGIKKPLFSNKNILKKLLFSFRNINYGKYIFTQYADIDRGLFEIMSNDFTYLSNDNNSKNLLGICIVGTNPDRFAWGYGMSLDDFWVEMEKILLMIKKDNPNKDIYYVPHGRDAFPNMQILCKKNGVRFIKAETTVELFLISQRVSPEIVYGLNSSALFSIKKIMPNTKVKNLLYTRPCQFLDDHIAIANYYQKHGIETIKLE